jgi:hypothetical protein
VLEHLPKLYHLRLVAMEVCWANKGRDQLCDVAVQPMRHNDRKGQSINSTAKKEKYFLQFIWQGLQTADYVQHVNI